jgi:hypothetical protein
MSTPEIVETRLQAAAEQINAIAKDNRGIRLTFAQPNFIPLRAWEGEGPVTVEAVVGGGWQQGVITGHAIGLLKAAALSAGVELAEDRNTGFDNKIAFGSGDDLIRTLDRLEEICSGRGQGFADRVKGPKKLAEPRLRGGPRGDRHADDVKQGSGGGPAPRGR